jgi:hypothetical protein
MKSGLRWVVLAVATLVSTSAWAVWDPDAAGSGLLFKMNFEVGFYDNGAHTATDAKGGLVGTLEDFNETNFNVFGETSAAGLGLDANFAELHDLAPGAAIQSGAPGPNDCRLAVPSGTGVFDLSTTEGGYLVDKHTWTFWFNVPTLDGTIIRHASVWSYTEDPDYDSYNNLIWEIRIYGGVLQFYHKKNCLVMQTASGLGDLGVTVNTWHHAAVVIDRSNSMQTGVPTTQLSTKIYVDGLEVPVVVLALNTDNMNVDGWYDSPLWIGGGDREFDGLLDDVRLFNRVLTPVEVSILNQPDTSQPRALLPIPRSSNVVIATDVNWVPAPSATAQKVYFGTDADANNLVNKKTIPDGTTHIATNGELGGPFTLNTKYYWYVKSTIGGNDSNGPLWSFTTETGKALNPSPANGVEDVNTNGVDLSWNTPTAATYAVYLSVDRTLVESNSVSVRIADNNSNPFKNDVNTSTRGAIYYWRVNCTYPSGTIAGDIWHFRTRSYELVFNTSDANTTYADQVIPAHTCLAHTAGWSDPCATGSLASDGVVIFDFPNGFNYDKRYDIVVVPEYRATDICSPTEPNTFPTPLAIHVTGNFYFDGRVQIAGDDVSNPSGTNNNNFARSGGFPGPKYNQDVSVFADRVVTITDYWTSYSFPNNYHHRFGDIGSPSSPKFIFVPTALAQSTFGPGQPVSPPYKGGGGGGYGGVGGDSGRGYMFGIAFSAGPSYGDKEVPVPFGGSAGGWGSSGPPGAAGGGGIEIYATGNVVLDSNSQINANGGGHQLCPAVQYPSGGGSGGSVRIIAGGSVTNKGTINVNGGIGGNTSKQANECGGGGGGGRVAIFYGTTKDINNGTITANGGARGTYSVTLGLGQNGQNGTIFDTNGSPKKASAPTPANGDTMVYYNPTDACTIQLKWYSGFGGSSDVVYWGTTSNPATQLGNPVSATRGQHSSTATLAISAGQTYYWKVKTDGDVNSDTWSFKTVNWRCRHYDGGVTEPIDPNHVGGPEWDFNHDCVLNFVDFAGFGKDWGNIAFDTYILDLEDLDTFASEWLECYNRTDNGCAGY